MTQDTAQKRPALLTVEDDPVQRQCLRRLLKTDWDVYFAETLEEAEAALARHPEIGILLCDHELPDGNGLDFCERLHRRQAPVIRILITGHAETALLMQAVNAQCLFHFVAKPYESNKLLEVLERAAAVFLDCAEARQTRLRQEEEENRRSVRQTVSHWAQIIFGVGSFLLATLLVVLLVTLVLGAIVFVVLYVLKSFLGIDLFADRHLEDFLPF